MRHASVELARIEDSVKIRCLSPETRIIPAPLQNRNLEHA